MSHLGGSYQSKSILISMNQENINNMNINKNKYTAEEKNKLLSDDNIDCSSGFAVTIQVLM